MTQDRQMTDIHDVNFVADDPLRKLRQERYTDTRHQSGEENNDHEAYFSLP
jgi:hypothetical protein